MELSLINVNVLHKRANSSWFSEIFFFLNKSDQNNPYAKEIYFGVAYSALLDMDVPQFVYAFVC